MVGDGRNFTCSVTSGNPWMLCVQSLQPDNEPSRDPRAVPVINRYVGNLPPMPGVFPDYPAPVIRNTDTRREMVLMRWGMPPPPRTDGSPVTNIRNTSSPHWRMWLKPEIRCLVPANSFAEYAPEPNPETKKDVVWFARLLFAFAGIWTEYRAEGLWPVRQYHVTRMYLNLR
jgi:putative SOS response-associated peptidase YedK